jgi:preprotein translocase YajC subunit
MSDTLFFLLALTFLAVWIFVSSRNRKKAAEKLRTEVVKGAYVMLTSGIYGKILAVKEDRLELETAPGQTLAVAIGAVRNIENPPKNSTRLKSTSSAASTAKPKTSKARK